MMGFSIPKVCFGTTEEVFFTIGILRRIGKRDNAIAQTYTTLTRHWLKNGTLNDLSRQPCTYWAGQEKHFKRHNYAE
jgi:hypothetical protein